MDNKWAIVGGIMSIVSGAFGLLAGLVVIFFAIAFSRLDWWTGTSGNAFGPAERNISNLVGLIYGGMGGFIALLGILALIGGIFALRRKLWGLALAGSIGGTICFFPTGIAAVIFTAMAKPEFLTPKPSPPNPPPPAQT